MRQVMRSSLGEAVEGASSIRYLQRQGGEGRGGRGGESELRQEAGCCDLSKMCQRCSQKIQAVGERGRAELKARGHFFFF